MKHLYITQEIEKVAKHVVPFEERKETIRDSVRFLAYAFAYGDHSDMTVIRKQLSDDDLREALDNAPPGLIDPRSWAYWNLMLGRYPAPAKPNEFFNLSNERRAYTGRGEFDQGIDPDGFPR
jgi:hypothetical protein